MNRMPATLSTPTLAWLRVFLALLVVVGHYGIYKWFYDKIAIHFSIHSPALLEITAGDLSGRVAVSGFFIISGYLVAQILQNKYKESSAQGLLHFIISRSVRLYPLYIIVLTLYFIVGLLVHHKYPLPDNLHLFLNYAFFIMELKRFF